MTIYQPFTSRRYHIMMLLITLILLTCFPTYAQVKPLDSVVALLNRNAMDDLKEIEKYYSLADLEEEDRAKYLIATGGIKLAQNNFEDAYKDFQESRIGHENKRLIFRANDYMMELNNSANELQIAPESLMEENLAIAQELNDPELLIKSKFYFMFKEIQLANYKKATDICYEMRQISINAELEKELMDIELNLGTLHYYQAQNDSALYYYNKNLEDVIKKKDTIGMASRLNNLAMLQLAIGKEQEAVENLITAQKLAESINDLELNVSLLRNIADAQVASGNYEKAVDYYNQYISQEDSLNSTSIAKNIKELQTKYETAETERENAELASANLNSRNKIYLLLFILASLTGIGAYLFNRMRQKQILMAAQAEVAKEKEETLLRNQQLAAVDAMITGQEKERKKIAQDLHDDIGSSLTTARLCIENVMSKTDQQESKKVLENAYGLLNETYTKVRNISHTQKNSVLSNHGLIGTLEQLAEQLNSAHQTNIEVVHHGLEGKLSNSMELGLFRIIQELINNTIKHAQATHASIILTGYDDHVDLIVEDNGKGYDYKNSSAGMGLENVKIRVENLDGTMEIDTVINRGTTVNIEIPII